MDTTKNGLLSQPQIDELLSQREGWQLQDNCISKTFPFDNYYRTIAFVNALAWMTHREDHHPELTVNYNSCRVDYSTHDVGGLSIKDFNCAAQADALFMP